MKYLLGSIFCLIFCIYELIHLWKTKQGTNLFRFVVGVIAFVLFFGQFVSRF